jgi:hypothetical protein
VLLLGRCRCCVVEQVQRIAVHGEEQNPQSHFRRRYDNVSMTQILYLMAQPQLKQ